MMSDFIDPTADMVRFQTMPDNIEFGTTVVLTGKESVILKDDKKDLLRVYSLSKLIYDEIQRLNRRNKEKKVLAVTIILDMQKITLVPFTA